MGFRFLLEPPEVFPVALAPGLVWEIHQPVSVGDNCCGRRMTSELPVSDSAHARSNSDYTAGGQSMSSSFDEWFQNITRSGCRASLLCFPYSGSGAAMFGAWKKDMFPGVELLAAKLPGRESRLNEKPRKNLTGLAEEIADAISDSEVAAGPLFLLGCSVGALLAFEVARSLRRRQIRTDCLFAAAARAPQGRWLRGSLHRLNDDRFLKKLHTRYGAVPQQMMANEELRRLLLPMLRADIEMFETYQYQSERPLNCQLVTLAGIDDPAVKTRHIYPWRELAVSYRHRSFPGDHYFVRTATKAVLQTIEKRLRPLIRP